MRSKSTWTIIIMSAIIRAKTISYSSPLQEQTRGVQTRFTAENGSAGSCNTTSARPHEFFDQTGGVPKARTKASSASMDHDLLGFSWGMTSAPLPWDNGECLGRLRLLVWATRAEARPSPHPAGQAATAERGDDGTITRHHDRGALQAFGVGRRQVGGQMPPAQEEDGGAVLLDRHAPAQRGVQRCVGDRALGQAPGGVRGQAVKTLCGHDSSCQAIAGHSVAECLSHVKTPIACVSRQLPCHEIAGGTRYPRKEKSSPAWA